MTCHKLRHFNSRVVTLDFNWNCCKLQKTKKFSRNLSQLKCVTRQIRYHRGTLNTESLEPSCRISPKTYYHAESTLFRWGPPNFSNITRDNKVSLWPGEKTYPFISRGDIIWDRGGNFGKSTGEATGASHRGISQGVFRFEPKNLFQTIPNAMFDKILCKPAHILDHLIIFIFVGSFAIWQHQSFSCHHLR